MFCKKCGAELAEGAQFCPKCGEPVEGNEKSNLSEDLNRIASTDGEDASPKSRLVAALLAYFLGFVGGHMFYVGKTGKAILMIIFFWTGIPAIIGFINFIQILCGVYKDSDDKYIKKW